MNLRQEQPADQWAALEIRRFPRELLNALNLRAAELTVRTGKRVTIRDLVIGLCERECMEA